MNNSDPRNTLAAMTRSPRNRKKLQWKTEESTRYPHLSPCWNCVSHCSGSGGYCHIGASGLRYTAHRFVYEQMFGEIPEGFVVRHKCDNRQCINPEHLELGTQLDNIQDAVLRGRSAKGEQIPNSNLTEAIVRDILSFPRSGRYVKEISIKFGIPKCNVNNILHNVTWRHVDRAPYDELHALRVASGWVPAKKKSSKYIGVYLHSQTGKWVSRIRHESKVYNLGCFDTELEAAIVHDNKATELGCDASKFNADIRRENGLEAR